MAKEVSYFGPNRDYILVDKEARNRLENAITNVSYNSTTGTFSFTRTAKNGSNGRETVININKSLLVRNGRYNSSTHNFELDLSTDETLIIPAVDLIGDINEYDADNVTIDKVNNTFKLSDSYKNKVDLAYALYQGKNRLITKTSYATKLKAGVVRVGDTIDVDQYGTINLPNNLINSTTKVEETNQASINIGFKVENINREQTTYVTKFDTNSFMLEDGKVKISDKIIDEINSKISSEEVLLRTGGVLTGNIDLNGNYIRNAKLSTPDGYLHLNARTIDIPNDPIATVPMLNNYVRKDNLTIENEINIGSAGKFIDNNSELLIKSNGSQILFSTANGDFKLQGTNDTTYNLDNLNVNPITDVEWVNHDYFGRIIFYDKNHTVVNSVDIELQHIFKSGRIENGNLIITFIDDTEAVAPLNNLISVVDNITIANTNGKLSLNNVLKNYIDTSLYDVKLNGNNLISLNNVDTSNKILSFDSESFNIVNNNISLNENVVKQNDLDRYITSATAKTLYQPIGSYVSANALAEAITTFDSKYIRTSGGLIAGDLEVANTLTTNSFISNQVKTHLLASSDTSYINLDTNNDMVEFTKSTGKYRFNSISGDTKSRLLEINKSGLYVDTNKNIFQVTDDKLVYNPTDSTKFEVNQLGITYNDKKILTTDDIIQYEVPTASKTVVGGIKISEDSVIKYNEDTKSLYSDMSAYITSREISDTYQVRGDYALRSELTGIYKFAGSVNNINDLPSNPKHGDTYDVIEGFELSVKTNNVKPGKYHAGTNFAWNSTNNTWDSLGGIFDTSAYVTDASLAEHISNNNAYIADNYYNKTEVDNTYLRLDVADETYVKLDNYTAYSAATSSTKGVVSVDNLGYMNSKPTISNNNGNIYLTPKNIENALGYIPAEHVDIHTATHGISGLVVIDKNNLEKTISVDESNGNIYLTKENLDNAAGFDILSKDRNDNLYVSLTKNNQEITGTKIFKDTTTEYYDGATNIDKAIATTSTWSQNTYIENIILPQTTTANTPVNRDLKFNVVNSITNKIPSLKTLMTLKTDGTLVKNAADGEDKYITKSMLDVVVKNIQDQIDHIVELITDMSYTRMVVQEFGVNTKYYEYGYTLNSITFNHKFNITPQSYNIKTLHNNTIIKTVNCVADNTYDSTSVTGLSIVGDTTFVLEAIGQGTNNTNISTDYIKFVNSVYYGTNSKLSLSNSDILNFNKILNDENKYLVDVNCGTDEYIYFAQPTRLQNPIFIIGDFEGGFELVNTMNLTNANGYIESYNIYRSDYPSLGRLALRIIRRDVE